MEPNDDGLVYSDTCPSCGREPEVVITEVIVGSQWQSRRDARCPACGERPIGYQMAMDDVSGTWVWSRERMEAVHDGEGR